MQTTSIRNVQWRAQFVLLIGLLGLAQASMSGEAFRNLGFDEINTNNLSLIASPDGLAGSGPITDVLPAWQLFKGTEIVSNLNVNVWPFVVVPPAVPESTLFAPPLLGSFAQGGYALTLWSTTPGTLLQRGTVPPDAYVLSYKYVDDPLTVEINGQIIPPLFGPLRSEGSNPQYPVFNVSAFRGQPVELKLSQTVGVGGDPARTTVVSLIDSIEFRNASAADFWVQRDAPGVSVSLARAAGSDDVLVAVGARGTILTSNNGGQWSKGESPTTNDLAGVVFGQGLWVIVGVNGTILTSSDARQWTVRASDTLGSFSAVTYAAGVFVAVGRQGSYGNPQARTWTSTDGITWADRSPLSGPGIFNGPLNDVIYTPEKQAFVAVGEGTVYVSQTGARWSWLVSTLAQRPEAQSVAFGGGQFVAAGNWGVSTSPDGLYWAKVDGLQDIAATSVAYADGAFWLTGFSDIPSYHAVILRSSDARNWLPGELPLTSAQLRLSVLRGSLWAFGDGGSILQARSLADPPQFRPWETRVLASGSVVFALDTPPGGALAIDVSADLRTWVPLQTMTNVKTRTEITVQRTPASAPQFYRAFRK